jgi:hypothetical protein
MSTPFEPNGHTGAAISRFIDDEIEAGSQHITAEQWEKIRPLAVELAENDRRRQVIDHELLSLVQAILKEHPNAGPEIMNTLLVPSFTRFHVVEFCHKSK